MSLAQFEPKKIYIRVDAQPITTSGIYHNSDLGLISLSSDGSNWITIADKNLGATSTDTTSTDSYGYYYQRGNNYGFPTTGAVNTAITQVNASTYGPGNYYSSSTFIVSNGYDNWDSSNNKNLWGGETGTNEAMRGPCDEGYHIPTSTELNSIVNLLVNTFGLPANSTTAGTYLKMPLSGARWKTDGSPVYIGEQGYILSSISNSTPTYANNITFGSSFLVSSTREKIWGASIRPFKNDAVQPDDSRTKLY